MLSRVEIVKFFVSDHLKTNHLSCHGISTTYLQFNGGCSKNDNKQHKCGELWQGDITFFLTLNRPGFLESSIAGGGGRILPPSVILYLKTNDHEIW